MPKPYPVTKEIKGTFMGLRKIQDRGRIQIPLKIRDALGLNNEDEAYWIKSPEGLFYIIKATEFEGKVTE